MLHVDVETTPNENSLKFLPLDTQVLDSEQGTGIVRRTLVRVSCRNSTVFSRSNTLMSQVQQAHLLPGAFSKSQE